MSNSLLPSLSTVQLATPRGRMLFPNLTEPRPVPNKLNKDGSQRMEHSLALLVPKEGIKEDPYWKVLWQTIKQYAMVKLDDAFTADGKIKFDHYCVVDGDESEYESNHGCWMIRAKSPEWEPPHLLGANGDPLPVEQHGQIYRGQNAMMLVRPYFYKPEKGGPQFSEGVNLNLLAVKVLGEGELIEGGGEPITMDNAKAAFEAQPALPSNTPPPAALPESAEPVDGDFDDDIPF